MRNGASLSLAFGLWAGALGLFAAQALGAPISSISGRVIERSPDLSFENRETEIFDADRYAAQTVILDCDGDGRSDLLTWDKVEKTFVRASMGADGSFGIRSVEGLPSNISWQDFRAADLNDNGAEDLIGLMPPEHWFRAYSDGNCNFSLEDLPVSFKIVSGSIQLLDFDGDGRKDLAFRSLRGPHMSLMFARASASGFDVVSALPDYATYYPGRFADDGTENMLSIALDDISYIGRKLYPWPSAWLEVPLPVPPRFTFVDDFNGDGLDDVLFYAPASVSKWWAAFSNGRTALEQTVGGFTDEELSSAVPLHGDFDGDGIADIAFRRPSGKTWTLYLAKPSRGLGNAVLRTDTGQEAVSAEDGTFTIPNVASGVRTISVALEGRDFIRSKRTAQVALTPLKAFNFVATNAVADKPRRGQVERFGSPPQGPYVCFGYSPGGDKIKWGKTGTCPPGYGVYDLQDIGSRLHSSAYIRACPMCCKLPNNDILTSESVWVDDSCPDNFVSTGSEAPPADLGEIIRLRCTKINTSRYQLGPETEGSYWGIGHSSGGNKGKMLKAAIPGAIRSATGKGGYQSVENDGCIGDPPGSLFVRKRPAGCPGLVFRQLQYAGAAGDPAKGTPVQMFPDCPAITNPYDPTAGCEE